MKIRIKLLSNGGDLSTDGELDRQTIEVGTHTNTALAAFDISQNIISALKAWVIAPGDTIRIEEVE